ncbi:MAG: hypothetical protein WBP81_19705 [Solirubrobacteraceae bacterium]
MRTTLVMPGLFALFRILREADGCSRPGELDQLTHPGYASPELLAERPN